MDPVNCSVTVPADPDRAYERFAAELGSWWPPEYTWSQAVLEEIALEPRVDGRCYERGPNDFRCDWGRVTAAEPGERIAFTWQIAPDRVPAPDPDKASEVEVRFAADDDGGTRVELEHRGFDRHPGDGASYRDALASEKGWPYMLDRYVSSFDGA